MGKDDKEKAKQEKEEKARQEKEEKEREKREKEENIKREKEDKEREKREKKEKKDQKESVTPHQPEKKIDDKPVVLKPISKPVETKPTLKLDEKPVAKPAQVKPEPKPVVKLAEKPVAKPAQVKPEPKPVAKPAEKPVAKPAQVKPEPKPVAKTHEKPVAKPAQVKPAPIPSAKTLEKPVAKPAQMKPTPKPVAKPPETKSIPVKPVTTPIEAKPTPKPAEKPVVFKTKISIVGAKPITPPGEQKAAIPKPATKPTELKPVPTPVERRPTPPPLSASGVGTQLNLPKWVPDTSIGGAADLFTKKLGSGSLKGDEDAFLFFKAMIEAIKLAQWAKKKEQKDFAKYIAEDIDQYTDVAYLFEIRGWKEKYLLLFTRESIKLGAWEGKFDTPPVNIGGIKVSNCVFFEMTPSKMLETMKGKMEEQLPLSSGEVTAIGSVRLAQMFGEWTQAFIKFIGQEAV